MKNQLQLQYRSLKSGNANMYLERNGEELECIIEFNVSIVNTRLDKYVYGYEKTIDIEDLIIESIDVEIVEVLLYEPYCHVININARNEKRFIEEITEDFFTNESEWLIDYDEL